jgi:4-hydroxybenzoate polyprenyltransferase
MKKMTRFIESMRVKQWVKNIFIFAPMIFSLNFFQSDYIVNSVIAFILFSLFTGAIYVLNDCFDKEKDKLHPEKRKRPIASGTLKVSAAVAGASILLVGVSLIILIFNRNFFIIAMVYLGLNLMYSSFLKKVVILDVMVIAIGFVLRVEIGGVVNNITLSRWILVITFLIAIFLALIKRRQEILKVGIDNGKIGTRVTLQKYNLNLLDQLISVSTSTTLISYIIYVLNQDILDKFQTKDLYLTVPFVAFGIFRYLYLTYSEGKGENPAEVIFSDIPFTVNGFLWVIVFVLLII